MRGKTILTVTSDEHIPADDPSRRVGPLVEAAGHGMGMS